MLSIRRSAHTEIGLQTSLFAGIARSPTSLARSQRYEDAARVRDEAERLRQLLGRHRRVESLLRAGRIDLVKGLYALCPYIAGSWPRDDLPSSVENEGIFISVGSNRGALSYGIEAFEARDPLAWPLFATVEDVTGLPPTVINVNECDPLRDEGIAFYRLLLQAGVPARCRQQMGTAHASDLFAVVVPDISRDTAMDIAVFAKD